MASVSDANTIRDALYGFDSAVPAALDRPEAQQEDYRLRIHDAAKCAERLWEAEAEVARLNHDAAGWEADFREAEARAVAAEQERDRWRVVACNVQESEARALAAEQRVAFLVAEAHGWQPKLEAALAERDGMRHAAEELTRVRGAVIARAAAAEARVAALEEAIGDYMLWEPGRAGHAAAHERLRAALAKEDA